MPHLPARLPSTFSLLDLELLPCVSPAPDHTGCPHCSLPPTALVTQGSTREGTHHFPMGISTVPVCFLSKRGMAPLTSTPLPLPPNQVRWVEGHL